MSSGTIKQQQKIRAITGNHTIAGNLCSLVEFGVFVDIWPISSQKRPRDNVSEVNEKRSEKEKREREEKEHRYGGKS